MKLQVLTTSRETKRGENNGQRVRDCEAEDKWHPIARDRII